MDKYNSVSVVIPAKNEAASIGALLDSLCAQYPDYEIIVVDDGSTDQTASVCKNFPIKLISHPYSVGNGGAIKSGTRAAQGDILVFMDGDGQHDPSDIRRLVDSIQSGHDMAIGARSYASQASAGRHLANALYNKIASLMVGHSIPDLTSGFRAVRSDLFREFLSLLPNGFSYPTTITMAFFRAGYRVTYIPVETHTRKGKSHISPAKDGLRFLLIIFRIGTLYSPLKLFIPISIFFFILGLGYYGYTYATMHRFTNMSAVLFITSLLILLIGLVSEQITTLVYLLRDKEGH